MGRSLAHSNTAGGLFKNTWRAFGGQLGALSKGTGMGIISFCNPELHTFLMQTPKDFMAVHIFSNWVRIYQP